MTEDELRMRLRLAQQQADGMGFPEEPQGGSSTNSAAVEDFSGKARSLGRGMGQGASFWTADEIGGVDAGVFGITRNPDGSRNWFDYSDSFSDRVKGATNRQRMKNAQAEESNPNVYNAGEFLGAAGSSVASAPLAGGSSLWGTALRGIGIGATEGALAGGGSDNDSTQGLGGLAKSAGRGAGIGGAVGGAAPLAVAGGAAIKNAVVDPMTGIVDALLKRANQGKANRAVMSGVRKSKKVPSQLSDDVLLAAREGQPEYTLMDAMGIAGQRQASGLARSGGDAADEIREYLMTRQADAKDRTVGFIDEAFGTDGKTRATWEGDVRANRKKVADAMYDQAAQDASPVDVRPTISQLDATIGQMTNSGIKPTKIVREYEKLRKRLAGVDPDGNPTTLSDYNSVLGIYRQVRDEVDKAYKAGDGALGEALKPIRDSLEASLSESSDLFRFAQQNYRAGSGVIDAFEAGSDMAKRGRAGDTVPAYKAMPEQQQRAARIGYGDQIASEIERNKAVLPNPAREMASTKRRAESQAMANDPALFRNRMDRENTMFETQNRALQGSKTADNLQDIEGMTDATSGVAAAARDMANFQPGSAISRVASALGPVARGQTDETRMLIAKILMSRNPKQQLAKALREDRVSQSMRRLAEALLRGGARAEVN
ncbi:hypothetical protein [Roseovarius confluentis]|uniref:hypothetical protein n=1 Tax=Roseovarius confluentis TaxID=1852027 RepID=UPI000CDE4F4D|nr:hypothetical protein [Roseovarius confluentis]